MFIRAYLRASTQKQDATRAKDELIKFVAGYGKKIACFYVENESGSKLQRPELMRLINDASPGDVLLCEAVDRISRLKESDWTILKSTIATKGLQIVSKDVPTSWTALSENPSETFQGTILKAINAMLLDMLAAVARKDYEDRRKRQSQGIEKAKLHEKYRGRPQDTSRLKRIGLLLQNGMSYTDIQKTVGCARATVAKVAKAIRENTVIL